MLRRPDVQDASPLFRGFASTGLRPRHGPNRRRIIRGCDGAVEIDEVNRLVTKSYLHPDRETAIHNVHREVAYASRFFEALAGIEGVACPRIIAWELSTPPRVFMKLCPGQALSDFLWLIDGRDARIARISSAIRAGLEVYTRLFDEPYYDCCFNNMLFDDDSGTLTFLDFVVPMRPLDCNPVTSLEASLGSLVGCACYTLARPAFLFHPREAYLSLTQTVMAGFESQVNSARVYACARSVFSQMYSSGGRLRQNYYRTVGMHVTDHCLRSLQQGTASN
ncbi:MAG TPA: hypothetical protein VFO57_06595 [Burkholderiales bacterium]|nr:hypothetical protein [Burkholderiales bacterium]